MSACVLSVDADFDLPTRSGCHSGVHCPEDSVDAADRWIGKLFDAFDALGRTPTHGPPARRPYLVPGPVLAVDAYPIIYRAERHPVEIVAVTQGSRDIPAFLRRRIRP